VALRRVFRDFHFVFAPHLHNRLPKKKTQHKQDDRAKTSHSREPWESNFFVGPLLAAFVCLGFSWIQRRKTAKKREVNFKSSSAAEMGNKLKSLRSSSSFVSAPEPPSPDRYQHWHFHSHHRRRNVRTLAPCEIAIDFDRNSHRTLQLNGLRWVENSLRISHGSAKISVLFSPLEVSSPSRTAEPKQIVCLKRQSIN
jgi:hypothetical protein